MYRASRLLCNDGKRFINKIIIMICLLVGWAECRDPGVVRPCVDRGETERFGGVLRCHAHAAVTDPLVCLLSGRYVVRAFGVRLRAPHVFLHLKGVVTMLDRYKWLLDDLSKITSRRGARVRQYFLYQIQNVFAKRTTPIWTKFVRMNRIREYFFAPHMNPPLERCLKRYVFEFGYSSKMFLWYMTFERKLLDGIRTEKHNCYSYLLSLLKQLFRF